MYSNVIVNKINTYMKVSARKLCQAGAEARVRLRKAPAHERTARPMAPLY